MIKKLGLLAVSILLSGCTTAKPIAHSGKQPSVACELMTISKDESFNWLDHCYIEMQQEATIEVNDIDSSHEGVTLLKITVTNPDGGFTHKEFPVYVGSLQENREIDNQQKIIGYTLDHKGNVEKYNYPFGFCDEGNDEELLRLIGPKINAKETSESSIDSIPEIKIQKPQIQQNQNYVATPEPTPEPQPPVDYIEEQPTIECVPSGGQQFLDSAHGGNGGAFQACVDACSSMASCECVPNNCGNGYVLR